MDIKQIIDDLESGAPSTADAQTNIETLQREKLQLENELLRDVVEKRKKYPGKVYCLIVVWLLSIFVILLCEGFWGHGKTVTANFWGMNFSETTPTTFHLDSGVLIALIGGTTASVISLFAIVIRNLFPKHDSKG